MLKPWLRLKQVLDAHFPDYDEGSLQPGASLAQIESVEAEIGLRLPEDVRAAYLHFDGVVYPGKCRTRTQRIPPLILPFYDWANIEWVVAAWREQCGHRSWLSTHAGPVPVPCASDQVRDGLAMDRGWIPIGNAHMSTYVACDLNPGPAGTSGQLIKVDLQTLSTSVISPSFSTYIEQLLDAIETRRLIAVDNTWIDARTGEIAFSLPCP